MSGRLPHPAALAVALALAVAVVADDDPEPTAPTREEVAVPAVDLGKAKTDKKLAAQAAANQTASEANLKALGIAFHEYCNANNSRLPDDIKDRNGKVMLSWRVALLPYMKQEKLYKEFKLDEAWDSAHNKKLLAKMPAVFRSDRVKLRSKSATVYQVFIGDKAVFGRGQQGFLINTIPDGTSNTIAFVETSTGVPWTKPGGIPFTRGKALPAFGKALGNRPLATLCDGSTRVIDLDKVSAATLENAIDPADGFPLGNDW